MTKTQVTDINEKVQDKLDELFPKGDKRRGDAMVLLAVAHVFDTSEALVQAKAAGAREERGRIIASINIKIADNNKWQKLQTGTSSSYCQLCMEEDYCYHVIQNEGLDELIDEIIQALSPKEERKA